MNAELSSSRPSLRIERFAITNYRTFRGRTELLLQDAGRADPMPVFHGENGSGKSNALAALDLFFRAARLWLVLSLQQRPKSQEKQKGRSGRGRPHEDPLIDYAEDYHQSDRISISPRDWPPGVRDPMELEVAFADSTFGTLRVRFVQAGKKVILQLERRRVFERNAAPEDPELAGIAEADRAQILNRLEAPQGANSHAFYWLDARRRERSPAPDTPTTDAPASPLSARLLGRLYALQTSMIPAERDRWRAFTELLREFPSLQGQETSLVTVNPGAAELRLEWRGRLILRHTDLSSGEQQCAALLAAVLTSGASLVGIEEPEISLSENNQKLLKRLLLAQVERGLVDQIFLESHVFAFDGPSVLRFTRTPDGTTGVERTAARAEAQLADRARRAGAGAEWVTSEGYTKLPESMMKALGLQHGGYLWFLRQEAGERWCAWKEDELSRAFGLAGDLDKGGD